MTSRVQLSKLPFKFSFLFTAHLITYLLTIYATVPIPPAGAICCVLRSPEIQPSKILHLLLIPKLHVEAISLSTSEHIAVFPSCPSDFCNLNSYDSFEITYLNKIILYKEFSGQFILILRKQQQLLLCVFCGSENLSLLHLHLPIPAAL